MGHPGQLGRERRCSDPIILYLIAGVAPIIATVFGRAPCTSVGSLMESLLQISHNLHVAVMTFFDNRWVHNLELKIKSIWNGFCRFAYCIKIK